jgi:hypothetical protein
VHGKVGKHRKTSQKLGKSGKHRKSEESLKDERSAPHKSLKTKATASPETWVLFLSVVENNKEISSQFKFLGKIKRSSPQKAWSQKSGHVQS